MIICSVSEWIACLFHVHVACHCTIYNHEIKSKYKITNIKFTLVKMSFFGKWLITKAIYTMQFDKLNSIKKKNYRMIFYSRNDLSYSSKDIYGICWTYLIFCTWLTVTMTHIHKLPRLIGIIQMNDTNLNFGCRFSAQIGILSSVSCHKSTWPFIMHFQCKLNVAEIFEIEYFNPYLAPFVALYICKLLLL